MHISVCYQDLPSCFCTQIFMLHIMPHCCILHKDRQGCNLFWLFNILCDHNSRQSPALYFCYQFSHSSQLHWISGIIQGYVWKHSCTHRSLAIEQRSISHTQTGTRGYTESTEAVYWSDNSLSLLLHVLLFFTVGYQFLLHCFRFLHFVGLQTLYGSCVYGKGTRRNPLFRGPDCSLQDEQSIHQTFEDGAPVTYIDWRLNFLPYMQKIPNVVEN